MDDRRFDNLAKRVGTSRRSVLKKIVGIGGAAAVARLGMTEAEAARRGYSGSGTGSTPNDTFRACRLLDPKCCVTCTLNPYDWRVVYDRLQTCFYITDFTSCGACASSATWGGIPGWCEVA